MLPKSSLVCLEKEEMLQVLHWSLQSSFFGHVGIPVLFPRLELFLGVLAHRLVQLLQLFLLNIFNGFKYLFFYLDFFSFTNSAKLREYMGWGQLTLGKTVLSVLNVISWQCDNSSRNNLRRSHLRTAHNFCDFLACANNMPVHFVWQPYELPPSLSWEL